jgi:hypothetical protein
MGQATVLHLLNGSIEKTRLLASAFRNYQHQACTGIWLQQLGYALTLLFPLEPFFSLCKTVTLYLFNF